MAIKRIKRRSVPEVAQTNWPDHVGQKIRDIYASREQFDGSAYHVAMADMLSPSLLGDIDKAAVRLRKAIKEGERIIISGDYDCDGATATAIAVRGLRMLGAKDVDFTIPDRFKHGYGLTPALIDDIEHKPALIVTVDSGVASLAGVAHAIAQGIDVLITDHHLPGDELPVGAVGIVNPNLKDDPFPSKALAGCGVMLYVLIELRRYMIEQGDLDKDTAPNLSTLLDIAALGTIADLVPLDTNNRRIVKAGIHRIITGRCHAGIKALMDVAGKTSEGFTAADCGFALGPRLNAAGRLANMRLGVELLICDDAAQAAVLATALDTINRERREIQGDMLEQAESIVADFSEDDAADRKAAIVYHEDWHAGVVGLVASRLKESLYVPTVAFANGEEGTGMLHGSCRSIPGFHLRDALALVDTRHPGLIVRFGGHAMAAGLTIKLDDLKRFDDAFIEVVNDTMDPKLLEQVLWSDGPLEPGQFGMGMAKMIEQCGPWGQAFPEPTFDNVFVVKAKTLLGDGHAKYSLCLPEEADNERPFLYDGLDFNGYRDDFHMYIHAVYSLNINRWRDSEKIQLMLHSVRPLTSLEAFHDAQDSSDDD